jgi:uncharacterized protein YqhQ
MTQQQFNYGGQAVMEGVMMRGATHVAVVVRDPEQNIVVHEESINSSLYSGFLACAP